MYSRYPLRIHCINLFVRFVNTQHHLFLCSDPVKVSGTLKKNTEKKISPLPSLDSFTLFGSLENVNVKYDCVRFEARMHRDEGLLTKRRTGNWFSASRTPGVVFSGPSALRDTHKIEASRLSPKWLILQFHYIYFSHFMRFSLLSPDILSCVLRYFQPCHALLLQVYGKIKLHCFSRWQTINLVNSVQ